MSKHIRKIISYDPGRITGLAVGSFSTSMPYTLDYTEHLEQGELFELMREPGDVVIVESFELNSGNEFTADLSGVEAIGILKYLYNPANIVSQRRSDKGPAGMMDKILKDHGLWQYGSDVSWNDGRDANDAIIHALVYLRNISHKPTLLKYFS